MSYFTWKMSIYGKGKTSKDDDGCSRCDMMIKYFDKFGKEFWKEFGKENGTQMCSKEIEEIKKKV